MRACYTLIYLAQLAFIWSWPQLVVINNQNCRNPASSPIPPRRDVCIEESLGRNDTWWDVCLRQRRLAFPQCEHAVNGEP